MKRIQLVLNKLEEPGIDGLLVNSVENVSYLTGFTGDSSHLIISNSGCILLTDTRYTEQAAQECFEGIEIFRWINDNRYGMETYQYFIDKFKIKNLGFEGSKITFADYSKLSDGLKHVKLSPTNNIVEEFRQVKDEKEIEFFRKACKISDLALEKTIPLIKPGIREIELTAHLEFNLKLSGADDISFKTIVLSGSRTSLLHGSPGLKKIEKGDLILFDFGALCNGYHADISRTIILGKANQQQKEIYNIILNAQTNAIKALRSDVEGKYIDGIVRQNIPESYIDYYYPGLGHGVGLQIHEEPFLKNTSNNILKAGMVITIEPGIYIPAWGGIRIEDTVLVKEHSSELLTNFPKQLIELN
jgi:Xaa-Pro aminopeptidase